MRTGLKSSGAGRHVGEPQIDFAAMSLGIGNAAVVGNPDILFEHDLFVNHDIYIPAHTGTVHENQAWLFLAKMT